MREIVKVSMTPELKRQLIDRANELNMSIPEYLRELANLDLSIQSYQKMAIYANILFNQIVDAQNKFDIHCMPIQNIPLIDMKQLENI